MPTPVYLTNWNHRVAPTANGGGLYGVLSGTGMSIDTSILTPQSLKCTVSSASSYAGYVITGNGVAVGRVYVYFPTSLPSTNMQFIVGNAASTGTFAVIEYLSASNSFQARQTGGSSNGTPAAGNVTPAANTLYRFDFRFIWNGSGTNSIDWQINGTAQTQFSVSGQTDTTFNNIRLGSTASATGTVLFQHFILSVTSADYPIGPGSTVMLLPSADGTHNAGTNVMEDNTGADIGVTPAYNKINTLPPGTTPYIQQSGTGANYAEVLFEDLAVSPSSILGVVASLGYTSATTTANRGACIVSKDSFSSYTTVWGNPTTTADYSDGSTANPYWKSAIVAGATDVTTVNALKARLGYSGDVSPVPYWMALFVEVAYVEGTGGQTFNQSAGGTLGLSGGVLKRSSKSFTGTLGLSGVLARLTKRPVSGSLTPSGVTTRLTKHPLGGSITPAGSISLRRIYSVIVSGILSLSGTVTKRTTRTMSGSLGLSGILSKRTSKSPSGSISPGGGLTLRSVYTVVISGILNMSGSLGKKTNKSLSGTIVPSGSITRKLSKMIVGSITPSGALARGMKYVLTLSGSLELSGTLSRVTSKPLGGVLVPIGSTSKMVSKFLYGFITPTGSLLRKIFKAFSGTILMSGDVVWEFSSHIFQVFVGGTLNLSGSVSRSIFKQTSGTLTVSGGVTKHISKFIGGVLNLIGSLFGIKQNVIVKTPICRIYAIRREDRIRTISNEPRLLYVPVDANVNTVQNKNRTIAVLDEDRTYSIGG